MQDIQSIFNRIKGIKHEIKEINKIYKEAILNSAEHKEINEELKLNKEKKKGLEESIKADFTKEMERLEILKADLESEKILLNDAALTKIMNGETIEITDENNAKYEPVFSVNFKKAE